jgi:hypothetical protein
MSDYTIDYFLQRVYASPSRRRMDVKGDLEEITYPNICFMVDNFDEVLFEVQRSSFSLLIHFKLRFMKICS